jgi:hypothetical protein
MDFQSVSLNLSSVAVVVLIIHMKSCVCRNIQSLFCAVQLTLFYENLGRAALQLLSRPCCFWAYFPAYIRSLQAFTILSSPFAWQNWHHMCFDLVCETQCATEWGICLLILTRPVVRRLMYRHVLSRLKKDTLCEVSSSSVCICLNLDTVINPVIPEISTMCTLQKTIEFKWSTH